MFDDRILSLLEGATKENPMTAKEIASQLNISDGEANPATRLIILNNMRKNRVAIGANNKGYWIIQNEGEMLEYVEALESRRKEIKERIELVYDSWYERNA
jgi:hypothetical protein